MSRPPTSLSFSLGVSTAVCLPTGSSRPAPFHPDKHLQPSTVFLTKPKQALSISAAPMLPIWWWTPSNTNAGIRRHYVLHAFVVMPNHVHLLITAAVPLPKLTKSLKGITAKRGNAILTLTGKPFWQEESYDHLVRNQRESENIRQYIEENPVRAHLVSQPHEYRWSSAGKSDI